MRAAAPQGPRSATRLFALYAAISLLPVLVLGVVLARSLHGEADQRGLAQARSEARLIAQTAVEPLLGGYPLGSRLSAGEQEGLAHVASMLIARRDVLRLRVRDLAGRVVFSDDRSGRAGEVDDEALDAAHGHVVALLTRVNSDSNDTGRAGVQSVEVYVPLSAGAPLKQIGVLELYLPYAPISRDVTGGLNRLYLDLAVGLAILYLTLFAITVSVSRGSGARRRSTRIWLSTTPSPSFPTAPSFTAAPRGPWPRPSRGVSRWRSQSSISIASRMSTTRSAIAMGTGC